ncbi:MAG: hypothetical protein H7259_02290 [Cytophagales bacterium]|nr:hypothetical protein [Cytophaga sp.]
MNRILLLILIGALTFVMVLYTKRPELMQDVWLWIIGLSGVIVRVFIWIKHSLSEQASNLSEKASDLSKTVLSKKDALIKKI